MQTLILKQGIKLFIKKNNSKLLDFFNKSKIEKTEIEIKNGIFYQDGKILNLEMTEAEKRELTIFTEFKIVLVKKENKIKIDSLIFKI